MLAKSLGVLVVILHTALAADPWCAAYPQSKRQLDLSRIELQRAAQAYANRPGRKPARNSAVVRRGFIDNIIFDKMSAAGVQPAPESTDAEFFRRVSLDLTGRIPSPEQIEEFVGSPDPNKRDNAINQLTESEAFVDYWTFYFSNMFEVTARYYNLIGVPGRNLFYSYLRDFVARDRSYRDLATELISASGDSFQAAPVNFLVRASQQGDPIQDTWDTLTDRVTVRFLGVKTECISCHDGRRHLEQINLYLTERRREEFMRLSAFFSRMTMTTIPVDANNNTNRTIVNDRPAGAYHGIVNQNNPGPRPPRLGGPFEARYFFTGEEPQSDEWRLELARILTADRQFARVAVNYLWAHMFTEGIVDPPDAWDLRRIDPANPPPAPWPLQPSHPELLEQLADEFINNGYRIRPILRMMAQSAAYQLSGNYEGEWRPEYSRFFARHIPRRLLAEEIYDAVILATGAPTPMLVSEWEQPVLFATQLPDVMEPFNDNQGIRAFLSNFGRGDWWRTPRRNTSTVLQVLYLMNDSGVNNRIFGTRGGNIQPNRVGQLMRSTANDEEAVKHLYLAALGRYPAAAELSAALSRRGAGGNREQWLTDVLWALVNSVGFLFNR